MAKALQTLRSCLSVNNNLCRKLVSLLESPMTFDERFNVASVPFFIPYFNLISLGLEDLTFKLLY